MTAPPDKTPHNQPTQPSDDVAFGYYIVSLVDFLGQSQDLKQWDDLPQSEDEKLEFLAAVHNTYSRIMCWREQFEQQFAIWLEPAVIPPWGTDLKPQDLETLRKSRECQLGFVHFSDTIVVYSPIMNTQGFLQAYNVCAMIITCGILQLWALAEKTVFRGAIEIGVATRFPKADLYGPVLANAHRLESKVADYPRILVGPKLLEYLITLRDNPDTSKPALVNRVLAERCLRLLCRDELGYGMVDYLNDEFFGIVFRRKEEWKKMREMAFSFVVSERDRFLKENNDKLANRYERMVAYFASRGLSVPGGVL